MIEYEFNFSDWVAKIISHKMYYIHFIVFIDSLHICFGAESYSK